jgi:hypothetical protein
MTDALVNKLTKTEEVLFQEVIVCYEKKVCPPLPSSPHSSVHCTWHSAQPFNHRANPAFTTCYRTLHPTTPLPQEYKTGVETADKILEKFPNHGEVSARECPATRHT